MHEQAPRAVAADPASSAVLTVLRLARGLERIDSGLTTQQYRILKLVGAGGERSARLAERLAVAKPTLTATADGLVAAGLAHREAETGDRRVVRLCLTPAGQAAVTRADAAYAGWFARLLEATGQPEQILQDLQLISEAMGQLRTARREDQARQPDETGSGPREGGPRGEGERHSAKAVPLSARPPTTPAAP